MMEKRIIDANREEAEDASYQSMLAEWDVTLEDGLKKFHYATL